MARGVAARGILRARVRPLKEKHTKREIPEMKLNNGRGTGHGVAGSNLLTGMH